eukprot:scaffold54065_cov16-Tisochrysis_lutea.AAC.2
MKERFDASRAEAAHLAEEAAAAQAQAQAAQAEKATVEGKLEAVMEGARQVNNPRYIWGDGGREGTGGVPKDRSGRVEGARQVIRPRLEGEGQEAEVGGWGLGRDCEVLEEQDVGLVIDTRMCGALEVCLGCDCQVIYMDGDGEGTSEVLKGKGCSRSAFGKCLSVNRGVG